MIRMLIARESATTGKTLRNLLRERGLDITRTAPDVEAVICYGLRYTGGKPALNAQAGAVSKFDAFTRFAANGIIVPEIHTTFPRVYPLLGRRFHHHGGTDIKLYLQNADLRTKGPSDFYVQFIPSVTEFRHWIYRRKHLGTYEKVLVRPREAQGVGRNYGNGYAFQLVGAERLPRNSIEQAAKAVDSLGLDFGAVDVLQGEDGNFYVLEVNTAPGVEGEGRQVIQSLADKITRWVELGYPKRRGAE